MQREKAGEEGRGAAGGGSASVEVSLEAVLRQMPGAVIVAEAPGGRILLESHLVAAIWRDPSPAAPDAAPPLRVGYHSDGSPYSPADWPLARTIATGEIVTEEEIEIRRGDGTRGVVLISASPVRGSDGAIVAGVATLNDVTERKRRDSAADGELEAANRAKSDFLAVISHELRTPLTAIIGYTELLELGIPEPVTLAQRDQLERVEIAARHLLHLIEDILTMISVEAGQVIARPVPIRLSELLYRAEVIIAPLANEKHLDLVVDPLEAEIEMETDPERVVQVLLNLLSNAVKFTDSGSVRMRARRVGETVEIDVLDTGVGVRPEHLEQVFEPFWQVEQPITRRAGGPGLGLAVSRRLAALLGGQIRVASEPGRGSTFTAVLPIRASA